MANKRSSEITDFREKEYDDEKDSLDRRMDDKKGRLEKSMTVYSRNRKECRDKQAEIDQIDVLEKVQAAKVSKDIHEVNETSHKINENNFKLKVANFLDEKNGIPKFYVTWDMADIRKHSKLETEEQWAALAGTPVAELKTKHGYR
jgi:hypothetical protein